MDDVNLSLDEIIQKKKINLRSVQTPATWFSSTNKGGKLSLKGPRNTLENSRNARPMVDARLKIIEKKRAKIRDARDKLVEIARTSGDARLRLRKWTKDRGQGEPQRVLSASATNVGSGYSGGQLKVQLRFSDKKYIHKLRGSPRNIAQTPRYRSWCDYPSSQYEIMDLDDDDAVDNNDVNSGMIDLLADNQGILLSGNHHDKGETVLGSKSTTRTMQKDSFMLPSTMPPLPRFRTVSVGGQLTSSSHGPNKINFAAPSSSNDPFDHYEMPPRPNLVVPSALMQYEPTVSQPLRGILRRRSGSSPPLSVVNSSRISIAQAHLSPSMRARLERAPNPNESMGIFSKMPPDDYHYHHVKPVSVIGASSSTAIHSPSYMTRSPLSFSPPSVGYRIVVSNLHSTVTQLDIKELFEDIGDLLESRLVRPGVAEVIYRTLKDAENAVDAYHNRQLDGQPMNCLLVNPRASNKPTAPAIKYGR